MSRLGKIIEGVWDCSYCGTDKIRGSIYKCPNCGRQRDDSVVFYMDNPKNYISDDEAEKLNKNPDWLCSFCDGLNSDDNDTCYNCGATRSESELNYFENRKKKVQEEQERILKELKEKELDSDVPCETSESIYKSSESFNDIRKDREHYWDNDEEDEDDELVCEDYHDEYNAIEKSTARKRKKLFGIFAGITAGLLLILGLIWLLLPKTQDVVIDGFSWDRTITIEEYKTVQESDWAVPDGGRVYDERIEIKTYVQVLDHYETKTRTWTEQVIDHYEDYVSGYKDLGNGRFQEIISKRPVYKTVTKSETYQEPVYRQDPVYATKYYYEIERWVFKENIKTSGNDKNPIWGDFTSTATTRESGRKESYHILTTNEKGKQKEYDLTFSEWDALQIGQKVKLKTYIGGRAELILE